MRPDWLGNVLQCLLAEVLEANIDPAADLFHREVREDDAPGVSYAFQPRGHVDTVAQQIAALFDDIANVDSNPEPDLPVFQKFSISYSHTALDIDATAQGFDDAGKFDQDAVAGCIGDTAVGFADFGERRRGWCITQRDLAQRRSLDVCLSGLSGSDEHSSLADGR